MMRHGAHAPTKAQQLMTSFFATVVGLAIAAMVQAGFFASVGLIVLAYIVFGSGWMAARRASLRNQTEPLPHERPV